MSATVILSPKGVPFESDASATRSLKARNLDPKNYDVVPHSGGWAIVSKDQEHTKEVPTGGPSTPPAPKVEYWWVQFNQVSSENDPTLIFVGHNGDNIYAERGVPVCMPSTHLLVIEQSPKRDFEQLPERNEMMIREISPAPFQRLRQTTAAVYQQYRALKAKARKQEAMALYSNEPT